MMCFSIWTFCVCLFTSLPIVSVSEDQQITVKTGDDVTLQCLDHRGGDIELLEWRRQDLEEDVFVRKHGKMCEDPQYPSFRNRVELRDPQMKDGNVSVILKNVTINDTGTYECYVRNNNTQPPPQLITTITITVIDSVKIVQPGEDVLLLCHCPRGADIILIKWIRPDLISEGFVLLFRDDRTYKNYQHPSFHGRVELRDPQMKDGDVSVILKNVNIKDTGTYECYVRVTGNKPQLISSVHLKVKYSDQQITVKNGDDVTLQCRGPRGGDIKLLMWRKQDLEEDVFICSHGSMPEDLQHPSFKNRVELRDPQMKDGDVSVILKNVNINDTGTYECYVRNSNTQLPPQLITYITMKVIDSGDEAGHTEDGGDKDGHVGLVVGLPVFALLLVAVIAAVGFLIHRKWRRPNQQNRQHPADEAADPELQVLNHKPEVEMKEEEEEEPQWRHEYRECNHKGPQASVFFVPVPSLDKCRGLSGRSSDVKTVPNQHGDNDLLWRP